MESAFIEYFNAIGLKGAFFERATEIVDFYKGLYIEEELKSVFISEYVEAEGNRLYENLWIFTEKSVCEAKDFLFKDHFDSTPMPNSIIYWRITKENYDFKAATQKSRMVLEVEFAPHTRGVFKASGENCDFLRKVLTKHILPNRVF